MLEVVLATISSLILIAVTIIWHEFGHIGASLIWSKDLIIVHIGRQDSDTKVERRVGRILLKLHKGMCVFPSYCHFYNSDISVKHRIYMVLAGPIFTMIAMVILQGAYVETSMSWLKSSLNITIWINLLLLITAVIPFKLGCGAESDARRFWNQILKK